MPAWSPVVRGIAVNTVAAVISSGLAFAFFALGFATEGHPAPLLLILILASIATTIALLALAVTFFSKHFPWLTFLLTPLLFAGILAMLGDRDFSANLVAGAYADGPFALGAVAGYLLNRRRTAQR